MLCNAVGVYKNSTGLFDDENNLLAQNNEVPKSIKTQVENEVLIYPNPTNDYVKIKHSMQGEGELVFSLYDASGRVIKSIQCKTHNQETQFAIDDIAIGIYTYKVFWNTSLIKAGKLNIIK